MRQRNDTPYAWHFAATPAKGDEPERPPYSVEPGDTADYPQLLDGWTPTEDEPAAETPDPPKSRTKKPANTEDIKGGEPQ